jgi:Dyp-type peroxidase family
MTYAFVTVIVPFGAARREDVDKELDRLGKQDGPPFVKIKAKLDEPAFVHFMSMFVVPAGPREKLAHLVFEVCADGHPSDALARLARQIPDALDGVLEKAGQGQGRERLGEFLEANRWEFGKGWHEHAGTPFAGTPGMSVERIRAEAKLADRLRALLAESPAPRPALGKLGDVREAIFADVTWKWAFLAEPAPLLGEAQTLADYWWPLTKAAFRDFLWPLLVPPFVVLLWSRLLSANTLSVALWQSTLALLASIVVAGGLAYAGYQQLRGQEKADTPSDEEPEKANMDAILAREDHEGCTQNHLAGVSILKPGWVRRVTLRLGLWLTSELEARRSKPGYLNTIGVIHFARWFLLPGTNKLVFLSNYAGSWQSYLEEFIARLRQGLTTVWSNTRDFPKTESLFRGGASDSTRFKRWARRQQFATRFWYSAYPALTTGRIRTNAEIRRGLVSVSTEAGAAHWLSLFGYPLPETLDSDDIPSLAFGGLARLRYAHCLLGRLGDDPRKAREWLKQIAGHLSYGEPGADLQNPEQAYVKKTKPLRWALVAGFTGSGLRVLLDSADEALATFPIPFQNGVAERSRVLGDSGDDAPQNWEWGGTAEQRIDVLLMVYASSPSELQAQVEQRAAEMAALGSIPGYEYKPVSIALEALPELQKDQDGKKRRYVTEPFGFRDGISQPIMRGSRRWSRMDSSAHSVEPGELVLGYRDNLGYRAPLPRCNRGEIGRNGTFLVVRQLEQYRDKFDAYMDEAAKAVASNELLPKQSHKERVAWLKAKMVGRWPDGTSLVKHPDRPGGDESPPSYPDNAFMFGREDRDGLRCPLGAHIRRANPRDSFEPESAEPLAIANRHRILRVGRSYAPREKGGNPGLLFMCVNADIERQFEFLQQTWLLGPNFSGLNGEIDPVVGYRGRNDGMTIPTPGGPVHLPGIEKFVRVRGGGYFFLPGRGAMTVLHG